MGTTAAAAVVIREKHIVEAFRRAGAITPDAAATPDSLGVAQNVAFSILVRDAVLRESRPGSYYLDEPSWRAKRAMRQRVAIVALLITAVVVLVAIWRGIRP